MVLCRNRGSVCSIGDGSMKQISRPRRAAPAKQKVNRRLYQSSTNTSSRWSCRTVADMAAVAQTLVRDATANVWLLSGPLGSGKTVFSRSALRALGFRGAVPSPTFTLSRHYHTPRGRWTRAIHIDAYRIKNQGEEAALDIADAAQDPNCLVLIEWPERLAQHAWKNALRLRFQHTKAGRVVRVKLAR